MVVSIGEVVVVEVERGGFTHHLAVFTVLPFVLRPAACVHEEVAHRAELESELLRDGDLHLFGGALRLLKNGLQGATLQVCKYQSRLLGRVGVLWLLLLLLFFPFAGCKRKRYKLVNKD